MASSTKSAISKKGNPKSSKSSSSKNKSNDGASRQPGTSLENSDSIVGYIHNVSPDQVSRKGARYFSFYVQERERARKAICFSPQKRKLVESKAESCTPCKVSKYGTSNNTSPGQDVLWINNNTRIDDAPDTIVDFPFKSQDAVSTPITIKDLKDVQVNELINVKGFVTFGKNIPEQAGTSGLTKLEGHLVDETDCISLTIWNDNIQHVEDGKTYVFEELRLKQFQGTKYLTSTPNSKFKVNKEPLVIPPKLLENATKMLKCREVKCSAIKTVEIVEHYSCVKCCKKIQSQPDSQVGKCKSCNCRFLPQNSKKSRMARVSVKTSAAGDEWFSLFEPALAEIVKKYNSSQSLACNQVNDLTAIEEEKLCEIILLSGDIILIVNSGNNCVNTVKFVDK